MLRNKTISISLLKFKCRTLGQTYQRSIDDRYWFRIAARKNNDNTLIIDNGRTEH